MGGNIVDNIMDKLAEKISAQEMIKANSQAEVETAINDANEALLGKVQDANETLLGKMKDVNDALLGKVEESNNALVGKMEESFDKRIEESNSKTHDVGVQTYRNIQALLNKQEEKTAEQYKEFAARIESIQFAVETKNSALLPLVIITLIVAGADLCINILRILGIL